MKVPGIKSKGRLAHLANKRMDAHYENVDGFAHVEPYSVFIQHDYRRNYRPYLEMQCDVFYIDGFDCDGVREISLEDAEPMDLRYYFSDEQLERLVHKGYFSRDFEAPNTLTNVELEIPVQMDLKFVRSDKEPEFPIVFYELDIPSIKEISYASCGYDLEEFFDDVPTIEPEALFELYNEPIVKTEEKEAKSINEIGVEAEKAENEQGFVRKDTSHDAYESMDLGVDLEAIPYEGEKNNLLEIKANVPDGSPYVDEPDDVDAMSDYVLSQIFDGEGQLEEEEDKKHTIMITSDDALFDRKMELDEALFDYMNNKTDKNRLRFINIAKDLEAVIKAQDAEKAETEEKQVEDEFEETEEDGRDIEDSMELG